jgi:glycosyltransferase involved in cell wall biosynthesis
LSSSEPNPGRSAIEPASELARNRARIERREPRILVVTSMYPIDGMPNYGAFIAEQVRSLRAAGVDMEVLFINPRATRLNYAFGVRHVIQKLRTGVYDVIHTHHTYTLPIVDLARTLVYRGIPVILTNHEGEALDETSIRSWHPASRLRRSITLKRLMARRADFVIFVSRKLAEAIATRNRYAVLPCGVDLDKFRPLDQAGCRQQLGIPAAAPVVFFPADPNAQGKRFALAKSAFDLFREAHPTAKLQTGGKIPHDEMPLYYNAADVVLQTSFYEASPTVVKEALACEVPLVSTEVGDTREIIDGVPYCFACPDTPCELASRLLCCVGRRTTGARRNLRAKGLSLDQVAQSLIQIYRRVGTRWTGNADPRNS